jgi:light-regulated signal transduction histidine kinase (bacteriophytochrome)
MNLCCDKNRGNSRFGLGLYISAQIIKRQQGRIWLECKEGTGCTFILLCRFQQYQLKKINTEKILFAKSLPAVLTASLEG